MSNPASIRLEPLINSFDELVQELPEVKRKAVEAAGEAVKRSLDAQIRSADLSGIETKGRVSAWQQIRLGSRGGWAAVSPIRKTTVLSFEPRANWGGRYKQHKWNGEPVTAGQLTVLLERGHAVGVRGYTAKGLRKYRQESAPAREGGWGSTHVAGRQFYSSTRDDAQKISLEAAEKVLNRIKADLEGL